MMNQRITVLNKVKNRPVDLAHALGFSLLTDVHNEWLKDMFTGKEDRTLQAHRGSYKTTCVSVVLLMLIIFKPNKRVAFIRKSDSAVKEIIAQVGKMLKSEFISEIVRIVWGVDLVITKENQVEISTNLTNDPRGSSQLIGMGIKGGITGKHYDYIFTDDIVTLDDRLSRAERERTKAIYRELQNIRNRGGRIYNTGTPWHKEDCFTIMPNIVRWTYKDTGLISEDEIEELKEGMTASLFAANYELKHIADDDVIFYDPKVGADIELARGGYDHLDSAYYGEDYSAYTAINIHNGKWYVYGRCWRKHVDDILERIVELHNDMRCQKLHNELNADKGYVAKELRKRGVKVATYTETQNKYIKITSYLKFEWKDVVFVEGTDQAYIDMVCDYNENAEHDDSADSLASLIRIYQKKKQRQVESIKV